MVVRFYRRILYLHLYSLPNHHRLQHPYESRDSHRTVPRGDHNIHRLAGWVDIMQLDFRRFQLVRDDDITGISGTGMVALGVVFPTGRVVIQWQGARTSTVVWDSIEDAMAIHGHNGSTRLVWIDE
jgi:hypothetical protein